MEKAARSHAAQGWIGGQVWSWRCPTFDCLWFQVTVNDDGSLRDGGGYGIAPHYDASSDRVGAPVSVINPLPYGIPHADILMAND